MAWSIKFDCGAQRPGCSLAYFGVKDHFQSQDPAQMLRPVSEAHCMPIMRATGPPANNNKVGTILLSFPSDPPISYLSHSPCLLKITYMVGKT